MNFSKSIKQELSSRTGMSDCCTFAQISGIIQTAGSFVVNSQGLSVEIVTMTDLGDFLDEAMTRLYGDAINMDYEKTAFGGANVYQISSQIAKSVLTDCGVIRYDEEGKIQRIEGIDRYLIQEDCCKTAFLRGAFLGGGSLSGYESGSFHMEFVFNSEKLAIDAAALLNENKNINAHTLGRRGKSIVYVKGGDRISDVLAYIGASKSVLKLNDQLIMRSVKNNINRSNNCLSANLDKMISAELEQLKAIEYINDTVGLSVLPPTLRGLAEFRSSNSNVSYEVIADALKISKSTVSHRMKKIIEIADRLRREN